MKSLLELEWFIDKLTGLGFSDRLALVIKESIVVLLILLLAWLTDWITRKIIIAGIRSYVKRSKNKWDDIFLEQKVFNRLSHIAPALVIYFLVPLSLSELPGLMNVLQTLTLVFIIFIAALFIDSFLGALHEIYLKLPISRDRPIKSYLQIFKIFIYILAVLFSIAVLTPATTTGMLTGIGAFTAVLLLIFKDTILGLVASMQLSTTKLVRTGDWIEMPQYGADGTVLDISLYTIRVQNWDKTISTIPTYSLVSESFINWRGMEESGGRRIKRSINLDMKSVGFVDEAMIQKFRKIHVLKEYIDNKLVELEKYNKEHRIDESVKVNGRRMTNLGVFRKYVEGYLRNHPKIHNDLTFLVRHLQPTDKGIPIEIYVFSTDQRWAYYEAIQADIFDHILAVVPEFGLSVYQSPTGEDFTRLVNPAGPEKAR